MSFPLLPSLKKDDNKIALPNSGEWITGSQNTLTGLVDSLKVKSDNKSSISSIPDVWARPILMHSILSDEKHLQYNKYVSEWRGILTIMAMRKMRGLNKIKLFVIEVPEVSGLKNSDTEFMKVVARSIPDDYLERQQDETLKSKPGIQAKIQLLTYEDKPLAILWPSILICPAVGLGDYSTLDIPWWRGNGLNDPIQYLSTEEKNSLYAWLQYVFDRIDTDEVLSRLITHFRDDLKDNLGDDFEEISLPVQAGNGLGITGICQVIDNPIIGIVDDNFLLKSQVLLKKQRENKKLKNLLIVSPDLDKQWNMSESEIIVGGYINASSCLHTGSGVIFDHNRLGDIDLTAYDAEIHMADEFFTDKVAIFYYTYNAFPYVLKNRVYSYGDQAKVNIILPIKKWLLDYLTPAFVAENVQIEVINRDIKVTLALPVSGMDGQGRLIRTSKVYKALKDADSFNVESDILEYDSLPLMQIWPNIRLRKPYEWKGYYTYFDTGDTRTDFHMSPVGEIIKTISLPDTAAEVTKSSNFPEAILCEQIAQNLSGEQKKEELGLLLLNQEELNLISTQNAQCKIGIDFGTTNTTAYLQVDNDNPQLIYLKNRKFYVTLTENTEEITEPDKTAVRRNFISEQEQPGNGQSSIKSMYHDNPELTQADPFFSGNIYYIDQSKDIHDDRVITDHIKTTEMKWDQVRGLEYRLGFLIQFCLQCMVEAISTGANSLQWSYSYPKSFSLFQFGQYQNTWNTRIIPVLQEACSLSSTLLPAMSESEAVAEYFKQYMRASMRRGILCLDIGGGSTDIAVWQDNPGQQDPLLNQTSLKFAGGNILNKYLWNRKENGHDIFAKLRTDNPDFTNLLSLLSKETSQHQFDLQLEALLRDYETDIFKSLPTKMVEPEVSLLIRDISFALAGIFFYSGMVVGYLRKAGKYDRKQLLPNCYVGGNASKLLNWAAGGQFSSNSMIALVFKQMLLDGIHLLDTNEKVRSAFEIDITTHPKQEVAYGLVSGIGNMNNLIDLNTQGARVLAGEEFTVQGEQNKDVIITAKDYLEGVQIDSYKPIMFQSFVEKFNRMMNTLRFKPIKFSENDFIEICTQVNQTLSDNQNEANGDILNVVVEPIFILVLKEAYLRLSNSANL